MIKSVILIVAAVLLMVINTCILFLKPEFTFAKNDKENYIVHYQKWIRVTIYMSSLIMGLVTIYFSINLNHIIGECLLTLETLLVVIYALIKYKAVVVTEDDIEVNRLFRNILITKFNNISKVIYYPNAKLDVKLKNKESFEVSFNSENFRRFYMSLILNDVKFKTGKISKDMNHVYLMKYNISIFFPQNMFREFYQGKKYFHNAKYLFSARNLENHEYLEGYYKESEKSIKDFCDLVKDDLKLNEFKVKDEYQINLNGYEFNIIKCVSNDDKTDGRVAYVHRDFDNYLVLYGDYKIENEDSFISSINKGIKRSEYEDGKYQITRV